MALLEEPITGVKAVKNYINGEWVESKGEIIDTVNPANYKTIARVPITTKEETDDYAITTTIPEGASYTDILGQAAANEEIIIKYYSDAAEQSKSLMADVPRNFTLVARKRERRVTELKSLT